MNADVSHLTSLFEHATEGIVLTNGKGNIVLINPAAERIFGYTQADIMNNPVEILVPMKYQHNHSSLREGFYQKPQNRSMGHGRDLFGKRKDGSEIPVEVSLSYYKHNDELFVIAFIVDIRERKKIEENVMIQQKQLEKMAESMQKLNAELENKVEERTMILKEALQELEESQRVLSEALNKEKDLNEIKSRFVSMASHEFRTPLSTVLSSASLISKYTHEQDQDKRDKHIKRIKDSVKHLNDLLEDFLSLGKLEEGKVSISPEQFELREFFDEIAEEMQTIVKQNQHIKVLCNGDALFITDKKLLKNILINLLSNAVKFSEAGSAILLSVNCSNSKLSVSVKDNGIGISDEDLQHIFSSFFRARNAANIEGSGLGLHIVKRYVDLIRGSVDLESKLNKGTTVTIELPELSIN